MCCAMAAIKPSIDNQAAVETTSGRSTLRSNLVNTSSSVDGSAAVARAGRKRQDLAATVPRGPASRTTQQAGRLAVKGECG